MASDRLNNPFSALKSLRESMPDPQPPAQPGPPGGAGRPPAPQKSEVKPVARAVVRLERSGRGGKEVTVIEHLAIPPKDREAWLKALKSGLGCGGVIEGDALVLQGDQRKRVPALLEQRGVRKVVVAN